MNYIPRTALLFVLTCLCGRFIFALEMGEGRDLRRVGARGHLIERVQEVGEEAVG